MPSTFWTHTIWYILLGIVTVIQIIFIFKKAKDKQHVVALYIVVSGIAFSIEIIIYCFLRVYDYYPMIFPHSPIDDGLAGNLFSQFSLTASALMIAVFDLKYVGFFIFLGSYFFIEELFIRLGVFSHNFYSTWVTMIGFLFFFSGTKLIYKRRTIYTKKPLLKVFFMYFGLFTLHMPTALWIQILTGIVKPSTELLPNEMNSYAFVSLLNLLLLSTVCMFVYYSKIKWIWKAFITLSLYGVLYLASQVQLIYVKEGWFLTFATIDVFSMYFFIFLLNKLLRKPDAN